MTSSTVIARPPLSLTDLADFALSGRKSRTEPHTSDIAVIERRRSYR
jgi:hypothetical protein